MLSFLCLFDQLVHCVTLWHANLNSNFIFIISLKGNTGVASFRDCAEECNGTAQNASCGVCLRPGEPNPALDCNNECLGDAMFDDCQVCIGGSTGLTANYLKDACGMFLHFTF